MRNTLQGTGGMRDGGTRGRGQPSNPGETVLEELDREIHRLRTVLEIIDLKECILALVEELQSASAQLNELLPGLERN